MSACICYVTDRNYILITLTSALQARRHAPPDADVFLLSIDDLPNEAHYRRACETAGITFLNVAAGSEHALRDRLGAAYRGGFSGRISAATLLRLIISEFVEGAYDRILYLDGDTQIYRSLAPLLAKPVPAGCFLAARDPTSIMRSAGLPVPERFLPDYDGLGLPPSRRGQYFNAGVILCGFEDWKTIGRTALEYFAAHPHLQFHDQDALNAACWRRHVLLSSTWNFPRQFMHLRPRLRERPALIHFMANPKPWHGTIPPWGRAEHRAYLDVVARHPALADDLPRLSAPRLAAYRAKSTYHHLRDLVRGPANRRLVEVLDFEPPAPGAASRPGVGLVRAEVL